MRWDDLTMSERAEVIQMAVKNKMYNLSDIRNTYNKLAEGGPTSDADLVDWIIKEEGFIPKPTDIGDGMMTLGSGLTSSKWHDLYKKKGNKWSAEDNRMAVAEEVANRRRWAEKNVPNWDSLPESSQKALLSYKYNYDFNEKNSPKLYQALRDSNLQEAARQMDATSKSAKFKSGLQSRRQREQEWFLSDVMPSLQGNTVQPLNIPEERPVSTAVYNPFITKIENTVAAPIMVPNPNEYITAHRFTEEEDAWNKANRGIKSFIDFNRLMDLLNFENMFKNAFIPKFSKGGHLYGGETENNQWLDTDNNIYFNRTLPEITVYPGNIRATKLNAYNAKHGIPTTYIPDAKNEYPIVGYQSKFPNDKPLEIVSPEFDFITTTGIFKPLLKKATTKIASKLAKKESKNIYNLTDSEWDEIYNSAVKSRNTEEIQRIRDLHFKAKTPNTKVVTEEGTPIKTYHTVGDNYDPHFTEFNPTIEGQHSSIYTTDNPIMSGSYANELTSEAERDYIIESTRLRELSKLEHISSKQYLDLFGDKYRKIYGNPKSARKQIIKDHPWVGGEINPDRQKQLYINLEKPLVINNGGRPWNTIDISQLPKDVYDNISVDWANSVYGMSNYTTRSLEKAQKLAGKYDGAIINDIIDYGGKKQIGDKLPSSTVYQVNSPNNLKLADAITYDDAGNIIPISKRDNFNLKDFRYSLLPFMGIGTMLRNNKNREK